MNTPASRLRARNLRTLAGLAALFGLPLVIAFFANLAVRRVAARYHERTRPRQQKTGIQRATA